MAAGTAVSRRSSVVKRVLENAFQSLICWRVLGAYACHAAVCVVYMTALSVAKAVMSFVLPFFPFLRQGVGIQSWHWWLLLLSFLVAMIPAMLAFVVSLDTKDALLGVGKHDGYVPRIVSSRLVKIAGRMSSAEGCVRQMAGLFLRMLASVAALKVMGALWMDSSRSDFVGPHQSNVSHLLAVACAIAYHLHCVFWSRDVLVFPSVERHRWVRWRGRLAGIGQRIVPVMVIACGWHAGLAKAFVGGMPWSLGGILAQIFFAANLLLLFSLGDSMVDIVMTERPRLGDYDSKKVLEAMLGCLDGTRGDLMRMLAMYDLSLIPSDGLVEEPRPGKKDKKAAVWRRQQIFADDTGMLWKRLSSVCMDTLVDIVASVMRVESLAVKLRKAKDGPAGTKWNTIPARGALAGSEVSTEAVHCLLEIAGHHQEIVLSIRFLSDMAYVSVDEDRYGVLQLSEPALGDILFVLLWAEHKIRQLGQWTQGVSSVGGVRWRAAGEELYSFRRADACLDVVRKEIGLALENLSSAFGAQTLVEVLEKNAQFKADASGSEQAAMKGVLARANVPLS